MEEEKGGDYTLSSSMDFLSTLYQFSATRGSNPLSLAKCTRYFRIFLPFLVPSNPAGSVCGCLLIVSFTNVRQVEERRERMVGVYQLCFPRSFSPDNPS